MKHVDLQGNAWDCSIGNIEPPISSYESINYDELVKVMERFKKVPDYNELIKDNNKKDKEIQRLNNIIEELEKEMQREDLSYIETQYVLDKLKELKEGK